MLVRRGLQGHVPLVAAAKKLQDEILSPTQTPSPDSSPLEKQYAAVTMFKKVSLATLGLAMQSYGEKLTDQQEVLSFVSDILMDTYASESVVLRAQRAAATTGAAAKLHEDAASLFVNDAANRVDVAAKAAVAAMTEGDTLRTHLAALRRLLKVSPINTVTLRRGLADAAVQQAGYTF